MVFTMRAGISDGFENRRCIILFEELYAEAIGLIKKRCAVIFLCPGRLTVPAFFDNIKHRCNV